MITKDTAVKIAFAYSEVEAAEALLTILGDAEKWRQAPDFRDAFGRTRELQLGVPSGKSGYRLLDVAPELGASIIRAHVAQKKAQIEALCTLARTELEETK